MNKINNLKDPHVYIFDKISIETQHPHSSQVI